jgi:DNA-binding NarL/FixJ family response regulator
MVASADDSKLTTLLGRLYSAADIPGFFAAVKAILDETLPQQRAPSVREKALLRALSPHVEATARKLNSTELAGSPTDGQQLTAATHADARALLYQLTRAERDIVELLLTGSSNKEIAFSLGKSVRTVKTQLTSVYKKCEVRGRSQLLAKVGPVSAAAPGAVCN